MNVYLAIGIALACLLVCGMICAIGQFLIERWYEQKRRLIMDMIKAAGDTLKGTKKGGNKEA